MWYLHPDFTVFALTGSYPGVRAYSERGWPMFEWSMSSMLHVGCQVLDLGKLNSECTSWQTTVKTCTSGARMAPLAADAFSERLAKKHFTNGHTDFSIVAKMYE